MNGLRLALTHSIPNLIACCRCGQGERNWDRIEDQAYCPSCQEGLAQGEAAPLVLRTARNRCAVCDQLGTICFHTFPLNATAMVEMDLCPEHLRCLLGRRLGTHAYHQLQRQLDLLGVPIGEIFLLHDAFYDLYGRALQPIVELD